MTLAEKIDINRRKHHLFKRAERVLRVCRQRCFDLEDAGLTWKYDRMVANCRRILTPLWEAQAHGREKDRSDRMMRTWE